MNNKILHAVIFATGAAIGSLATWQIVKKKYENLAQEEIDSVKESFANRESIENELIHARNTLNAELNLHKPDVTEFAEYSKIAESYAQEDSGTQRPDACDEEYPTEDDEDEEEIEEPVIVLEPLEKPLTSKHPDRPYVISYEEFGEFNGYATIQLNWYADAILSDDWGNIVEDVEGTVGFDALNKFGYIEDQPDIVYVRNDAKELDYEICKDNSNYDDVFKNRPQFPED